MRSPSLFRAVVFLALAGSLAASAHAAPPPDRLERPDPPPGFVDRLDPDRGVRDAVPADVAARLRVAVEQHARRGSVWTETMFHALAAVSAELELLARRDRLPEAELRAAGALAVISVLDRLVRDHPDLEPRIESHLTRDYLAPIERYCRCVEGSSRACGCSIVRTGPNVCDFDVYCPDALYWACALVNVQLCITEVVVDIVR